MKYSFFPKFFKVIFCGLNVLILALTALTDPMPADTDTASVTKVRTYTLMDAYITGQGYDSDDEYYYSSGAISAFKAAGIAKIDKKTGEIIAANYFALPNDLRKLGYDHIGDITVANGYIYAPVEDVDEIQPLVLLYSADTLEYTGVYYELDNTYLPDGIPWCANDENYLYTSAYHDADKLLAFNIDDMSFSHAVELTHKLDRNQGGDLENGVLYMNTDPKQGNKEVWAIDPVTGETTLLFDRNTTGVAGTEAEGICVETADDGTLTFRIADYNKILSTVIKSYTLKIGG